MRTIDRKITHVECEYGMGNHTKYIGADEAMPEGWTALPCDLDEQTRTVQAVQRRLYLWAMRTLQRAGLVHHQRIVNTGGGVLGIEVHTDDPAASFLVAQAHASNGLRAGWYAYALDREDDDDEYGWETAAEALTRAVERFYCRILGTHCTACGARCSYVMPAVARVKRPSKCVRCEEADDLVPYVEFLSKRPREDRALSGEGDVTRVIELTD